MSWEMVPFIKVCNIQGGTQPPKSMFLEEEQEGYIRLLQIQDFKRSDKAVFVPDRKTLKKCNEDDILIGRYGASVGKILTGLKGAYNVALVKTVPNLKKLNKKYLYHFLRSPCFQNYILNVGSRAAQAGFNKDDLAGLQIPLPPLPEQQRIADILDKAEAINQKREQALALCDEFLRATFLNMFGDPVSNPKGWEVKKLSKFGEVITGSTPSRGRPEYYGNHIEWIKSDNINTPNNYITRAKEFLSVEGESVGRSVPENSILMTCIAGSLDCIGNIALADRKVSFNQQINGIVPNNDVDVYFLYSLLLYSKKYIQNHSTNSMKGMISKGKLSEIKFYLPEMAIQKEFSDIFLKIESLRNKIQHAQKLPLFDALSQQAFKGELTQ